jgi:predicted DNA-binding protein
MMITSSTRLSKEETEKLLKIKEETGTCISSLIREAVCDYLETKEGIQAKQIDDCFFQEYEEPSTEVSSP